MKSVLVTGGCGFIGSHLVDELLARGYRVHVVDNLTSNAVSPDRWSAFSAYSYDDMPVQDWCDSLKDPGYDESFDEIYHLASPVGPAGILKHSGEITRQIVLDTYAVIDLAIRCNAKLIDVSTSEIYGGGANGLCSEDTPRIVRANTTVRLEYAIAKLAAETAIINICRSNRLRAVIVRPFNVAGPRQSAQGGFVLPRFIEQALRGEPLTVFGNGLQVRAFTHVLDIVDGLIRAAEYGTSGEAYNLGNPANKITVLDLAKLVNQSCKNYGQIEFTNGKDIFGPLYAEAADKYPDASKALQELHWRPTRTVRTTIYSAIAEKRVYVS